MKNKTKNILFTANCLPWTALLVWCFISQFTNDNSLQSLIGIYLIATVRLAIAVFAIMGLLGAVILPLAFKADNGTEFGKTTVTFAAITNVLSYLTLVLCFCSIIAAHALLFVWPVFIIASCVMIIIQAAKKRKAQ